MKHFGKFEPAMLVLACSLFTAAALMIARSIKQEEQEEPHAWSRWSEPKREFGASVFADDDVWTQCRIDTNTGYAEFRVVARMPRRD